MAIKPTKPVPKQARKDSDTTKRLGEISEAFEIEPEEVQQIFRGMLKNENEVHSSLDEASRKSRAIRRTYLHFRRKAGFGNVPVEGVFLSSTDAIDMLAKKRREAIELFNKNPTLAVKKGLTDEEGVPLDNRKTFGNGNPNKGYGKPLADSRFQYVAFGIFTWEGEDTPTPMTMFLDGKGEPPPLFKQVTFKASKVNPGEDGKLGIINIPEKTQFEVAKDANVASIVAKFLTQFKSEIADLGEYVAANGDRNTVVVEGDVTQLYLEPDEGRSRSLTIDDDSTLGNREIKGARVWLPDHMVVDFAEDSRVIVFGSARSSDKGVSISAGGIYALPEYKIEAPDMEEFKEEEFEGKGGAKSRTVAGKKPKPRASTLDETDEEEESEEEDEEVEEDDE